MIWVEGFNLQDPLQASVEISIYTFHVAHCDLFVEDVLVEWYDKEGIQETTMEDSQTNNATNESKVVEMLGVDSRVGVDLKRVIVMSRVLEQAIKLV